MNAHFWRLLWRQMYVQLRVRTFNFYTLALFFIQPAIFSAVGMTISRAAGNPHPDLVYTVIGGGIMGMWSGLVFSSTFDIRQDRRDGTLELIIGSPTSLGRVEGIRTFANVVAGLISLFAATLIAVLVFKYPLQYVNLPAALLSLGLILFGMWCIGVFLANFVVLSRLTGTFVDFLELPVAVFCGFMYPIRVLPGWMQAISAAIPIRWALQALDTALSGTRDLRELGFDWGMAVGISLVILAVAHWLEGKVHDQIRITGELRSL